MGEKDLEIAIQTTCSRSFNCKGEQRNGLLAGGRSRLERRVFEIEKVLGGLRRKEAGPGESGRAGGPGKWVGSPGCIQGPT